MKIMKMRRAFNHGEATYLDNREPCGPVNLIPSSLVLPHEEIEGYDLTEDQFQDRLATVRKSLQSQGFELRADRYNVNRYREFAARHKLQHTA